MSAIILCSNIQAHLYFIFWNLHINNPSLTTTSDRCDITKSNDTPAWDFEKGNGTLVVGMNTCHMAQNKTYCSIYKLILDTLKSPYAVPVHTFYINYTINLDIGICNKCMCILKLLVIYCLYYFVDQSFRIDCSYRD